VAAIGEGIVRSEILRENSVSGVKEELNCERKPKGGH